MPKIMKSMNIISRCQAAYRAERTDAIPACHHVLFHSICRAPGRTQEELARDIRLNKSTLSRALASLEEKGFIERKEDPEDKRALLIYPTEKMLSLHPVVREISAEWNALISRGISDEEMAVFSSVIEKMEKNARETLDGMEEAK